MKKSAELIGLPVFSIAEATEIGIVKSIVINPITASASALVIDDGKWYLEAKLLPIDKVCGIGESALIIQSCESLIQATASKEMQGLLESGISVIGTKALTNKGQVYGIVSEILLNDAGNIMELIVTIESGSQVNLSAQNVYTYGKAVTIINAEGEANSADCVLTNKIYAQQNEVVSKPASTNNADNTDITKKTDDKHRKYILGKKASRQIQADNGVLIVEEGAEITEEILQKAKLAGKFIELSTSIK